MGVLDKLFDTKKQVSQSLPASRPMDIAGGSQLRGLNSSSTLDKPMTPIQGGLLGPIMRQQGEYVHPPEGEQYQEFGTDRASFDHLTYPGQIERLIGSSVSNMPEDWPGMSEYPVGQRVGALMRMLYGEGRRPDLTEQGGDWARGGWYSPRRNLIYVDPEARGSSSNSAYSDDPDVFTQVGISRAEQIMLAELGHAGSERVESKESDLQRMGLDKFGTGGNLRALLERGLVGTGQNLRDLVLGYEPKTELGTKFEDKILDPLSEWLAGYSRPGSEEHYAHSYLQPQLEQQYRRRLAGYEYDDINYDDYRKEELERRKRSETDFAMDLTH